VRQMDCWFRYGVRRMKWRSKNGISDWQEKGITKPIRGSGTSSETDKVWKGNMLSWNVI